MVSHSINHHPALLYNPRNPTRFPAWTEVVTGVNYAVIDTADWRTRAVYDEREVSSLEDFVKGLESRCTFFLPQHHVPDTLDVRYSRSLDEKYYAERLAMLPLDPFQGASRVRPEMLLLSPHQLGVTNDGSIQWWSGVADCERPNFRPNRQHRGEERRHRHRLEAFISYHDKEAGALFPRTAGNRYPKLPFWWPEYEVPYGFRAQTPPVLTYRGIEFMRCHSYGRDLVLRTEWAAMCVVELYNEAQGGFLWWLPSAVLNDIDQLGVSYIFDTASSSFVNDIESLLWEIKCIRWDQVSVVNRFLPRFAHEPTPTFQSGDFVEFNTSEWRTELDASMYLPLDVNSQPVGVVDRGQRIQGATDGLPSYSNPHGRLPGLDEQGREPGYRLAERHGVSKTRWASARGVLRSLAEQHGIFGLLQDLGHRVPFDPKIFMEHYRELLLEKVAERRASLVSPTGGESPPYVIATAQRISGGPLVTRLETSRSQVQQQVEPSTPQPTSAEEGGVRSSRRVPDTPVVDLTSPHRERTEGVLPPYKETPAGSSTTHAMLGQDVQGTAALPPVTNQGSSPQDEVVIATGWATNPTVTNAARISSGLTQGFQPRGANIFAQGRFNVSSNVQHNGVAQVIVNLLREGSSPSSNIPIFDQDSREQRGAVVIQDVNQEESSDRVTDAVMLPAPENTDVDPVSAALAAVREARNATGIGSANLGNPK